MEEGKKIDAVAIGSSSTQTSNKRQKTICRKNQGSSEVWTHMNRHLVDGVFVGTCDCLYCGLKIKCPFSSGTTLLWNHLKKRCKKYPHDRDEKQKLINLMGSQALNWKFDQETCRKLLARMIILCELPFSFVEKEGFKLFVKDLNSKFNVVSRTTITKDCLQLFFSERAKLKEYFSTRSTRVSLTTDMWTSNQNLQYMCLTAHYVDKDWKLQKRIINFCVLPHPHKGEVMAKAIESCLLEWGLDKICTITLDNAKNNDKCVADLKKRFNKRGGLLLGGELFHVRCFAHIINLVVRDGLIEMKDTIKQLRMCVKYVRSSSSRLQMFKSCASDERITSKKNLCLDVKTRWNSTYLMIGSSMPYEKAFNRLEDKDPSYKTEVSVNGMGTLEDYDWGMLKALHTFLEDFFLLTKRVSGSKYTNSNTYFDELSSTKDLLLDYMDSTDFFFREMAKKMNQKFDKYCDINSLNVVLVIATVLDPRHKLQYVGYWYSDFFAKDKSLSKQAVDNKVVVFVDKFKSVMTNIYYQYKSESSSTFDLDPKLSVGDVIGVGINIEKRAIKKQGFSNYFKRKENVEVMNDLDRYLNDGVEDLDDSGFDILSWWQGKVPTYRALALMAHDILAIPVTSVASECAFSTSKRILDQFRSSLTPKIVECLVCTQDWIKNIPTTVEYEDTLDELENIEQSLIEELGQLSIGSGPICSNV